MADIKDLLNDIIHDDNTTQTTVNTPSSNTVTTPNGIFDKANFREKLSLNVLKDIIAAMMHDETKDLDGMIDASIKRHIDTNYNGSCYNYLQKSCDTLGSPLLGSIIQEINNKTEEVAEQFSLTHNTQCINEAELKTVELLKSCDENETYAMFRERLRDKVSKDIIKDVSAVVIQGNDAPVFDDIDEKIKQSDAEKDEAIEPEAEDTNANAAEVNTEGSVIVRMCGSIVQESVLNHTPMSTEEGMNKAIIEYCIVQMDRLFKQNTNIDGYSRYLK